MRLAAHVAGLVAATTLFSGCTMTKDTAEPAKLTAASTLPALPVAARVDHEITQLGRTRNDPYNWLKDENWQEVMREPSLLPKQILLYRSFVRTVFLGTN